MCEAVRETLRLFNNRRTGGVLNLCTPLYMQGALIISLNLAQVGLAISSIFGVIA